MKFKISFICGLFFQALWPANAQQVAPETSLPWIQEGGLMEKTGWTSCAEAMIKAISQADTEGLNPKAYEKELLSILHADFSTPEKIKTANDTLTQTTLQYISDIKGERLNPRKIDKELYIRQVDISEKDILAQGLGSSDCKWIAQLPPSSPTYQNLKTLLAQLRQIKGQGGWPALPSGTKLKIGDTSPTVEILRDTLVKQGVSVPSSPTPQVFDGTLEAALKDYQTHHGLEPDGTVGPNTLKAINTSVEDRIKQVIVTMERERWMPEIMASNYIRVNIPGYYLQAVRDGKLAFTMPVITGKHYRETPVFNAPMTAIIFNPSWHVPSSIATQDKLPKLQRNANAFAGQGYHFYDSNGAEVSPASINWSAYSGSMPFSIRQDPGDKNALGRIRFTIENNFNVYLHGTPSQNLFEESARSFSSGCIRLEDPAKLAAFVFNDPKTWSLDAIKGKASSTRTENVKLKDPLQVYVTYETIFWDENNKLHMVPDVYGQDAQIERALGL